MKAVTYLIRLTEPLLATQVNSGEPNSAISFPYVPGSMIRGAMIRRYIDSKSRAFDLAADEMGRELFLDGKVQYLNAYPYDIRQKQRLLPKPFSWFVEKDDLDNPQASINDFAVAKPTHPKLNKPKSPRGDFTGLVGGNVGLMSPERQINVHNFTDDPGRKQQGVSQVYRYDALAAGQTFAGAVVAADGTDLSVIERWLQDAVIVLGGSHTGGYGRVEISSVKTDTNWQEYKPEAPLSGKQILTFLSDAIIRTPNGQVSAALAQVLDVDPKEAFQKTYVIGGFNRKWGLPLSQAWAIQAGSVLCLPDTVDTAILQDWVENGVGERRSEGYGRVALNWHTQSTRPQTKIEPRHAAPPPLTSSSQMIAKKMSNRHLRSKLEDGLMAALDVQRIRFAGLPSSTQLSRVRLAARHALAQQNLALIKNHMESLTGAEKDWENATFQGNSLRTWIVRQSQTNEKEFREMFGLQAGLPKMVGISSDLQDGLEVEFRARLIDGVMKLAVKESQKQDGGRS